MVDQRDSNPGILPLSAVSQRTGGDVVGGKALGLARLLSAGLHVPPGFVITRPALKAGLQGGASALDEGLALAIVEEFDRLGVREVAVRSSAPSEDSSERSHAGCYASFLKVERDHLLGRVLECWGSAEGRAAREYAARVGGAPENPAVIIQVHVDARLAGVAFSRDPSTGSDEIILECVRGPGDALVSGVLTPDRYSLSRAPLRLRDAKISAQSEVSRDGRHIPLPQSLRGAQKLTEAQLYELAETTLLVEEALGGPVDIEWVYDIDDRLLLVQARPITVEMPSGLLGEESAMEFIWEDVLALWQMDLGAYARGLASGCLWSNEARFVYFREGERTSMFAPPRAVKEARAKAEAYHVEAFMEHEWRCLEAVSRRQDALFRAMDPRYVDYERMSGDALGRLFRRAQEVVAASLQYYSISSARYTDALVEAVARALPDEADLLTLISPPVPDLTEVERYAWAELGRAGTPTDEAYLGHAYRFPWLTVNHHSYESVLDYLKLRSWCGADERERHERLRERQAAILAEAPHLRRTVNVIHGVSLSRMKMKRGWAGIDLYMIPLFAELCRRSRVPLDELLSAYLVADIEALIDVGTRLAEKTVWERRKANLWSCRDGVIEHFEGERALHAGHGIMRSVHEPVVATSTLRGVTACRGRAEGRVYVLSNNEPEQLKRAYEAMAEGTILVSQMLQPNMIDLLQRCAGVVTDEGGLLSHAAILAREFATPCVVGTKSATRVLETGDQVVLHGDGGVERLALTRGRRGEGESGYVDSG